MNFIKLTLVSSEESTGKPVFVNLDLVSEIREHVTGSILFYNFLNEGGEIETVRVMEEPEFFNDIEIE